MMDARAITKALGGRWCGTYGLARCPSHDDRHPSLKIKDDSRKSDGIDLHCFAGCGWHDVKGDFRRRGLLDDNDHRLGSTRAFRRAKAIGVKVEIDRRQPDQDLERRLDAALRLWGEATSLNDTLGQRYFIEWRELDVGLLDDLSHVLRWHDGISAVVALMTNPLTSKPTGVHRTFLNADATKRERKMLGKRGVVRLNRDEDVTQGLGITEGIEDGMAVLLSGWAPVWAATSAGAIASFPVLACIEALTIFRDDNEVGVKAAENCAQRWVEADREAFVASIGVLL